MLETYAVRLDRLEKLKADLLTRLDGLETETLNQKPADGGWSPGQVVAHIIEAERKSLEYVRKKTQSPESIPRRTLRQWLNGIVLSTAMRSPFKFEVPPAVGEPPESLQLDKLRNDWRQVRDGWREFLGSFPPDLKHKTVYRHPVAGPLSMDQALTFMVTHLQRHTRQIRKALG